jgi:hypothetical protein
VPRSGGWLRSRRQVEIPRRVPGRGFNLLSWAGLVRGCIAEKRKQSASRVLARTAMPLVSPVGDALIFVRVNQVLVRLWACLLACLTGCAVLRGGLQRVGWVQRCCVHATGLDPVVLSEVEIRMRGIQSSVAVFGKRVSGSSSDS